MANCNWLGRALNINCEHCDFAGNCGGGCCRGGCGCKKPCNSLIPDCETGGGCGCNDDCCCGTAGGTVTTGGAAWTSERCCNDKGTSCGCGCRCR